ncbi:MAG: MFS transporter [Acidimicrobiia bacterium]
MSRKASPNLVLAVVGFGVFIAADDLTVVATMLRPIIGDLGIVLPDGLNQMAWIVNAYLIAYVTVMPFMGRLSDVWGRRRTYITALAIFLAGSIVVPLAPNYGIFLVGRVLTAMGGGALVPIGLAIVADVFSDNRRARALGTLGAIDTLGWVWGPLYGAILVRFLSWRWQFYLNIPLAIVGIVAAWYVLEHGGKPTHARMDWIGAGTLSVGLVAINVALLESAQIQSVTGLEELTGSARGPMWWLLGVAAVAIAVFVAHQARTDDPLVPLRLFKGRNLTTAISVNFLVGATLVIVMVDVPLFVNVIESGIERAAVIAGWVLSALTAAMAAASYAGGRMTERWSYRPPVLFGLVAVLAGFLLLGTGWTPETSYVSMAWQLAVLGVGFGLIFAPVSAAVVDSAPAEERGVAASLVMVLRLMGLSVGLSGLTAWGIYRYGVLRTSIVLPPLGDPTYQDALRQAQEKLTTSALAETFLAAAAIIALGIVVALLMRNVTPRTVPAQSDLSG